MTNEQKMEAIIESQVNGAYADWKFMLGRMGGMDSVTAPYIWVDGNPYHSIEILLDPQGLRAAYGHEVVDDLCDMHRAKKTYDCAACRCYCCGQHEVVAKKILDTWLTSNGDAVATIDTAFSLLPK